MLALRDGDVLHVPGQSRFRLTDRIELVGRVARTGSYPIRGGVTRLSDVLDAAGGLLADGDSTAIELSRPRSGVGRTPSSIGSRGCRAAR
jgi:protein involved in polysaccharide export with SLBB domain